MIRTLPIETSSFSPGETLTHKSSQWTHITITYNVAGERYVVDQNIDDAIDEGDHLIKVPHVNTTLYWQIDLGDSGWDEDDLAAETEKILRRKLKDIFIRGKDLDGAEVSAFCMVGNLRAFAFELS